MQPRDRLFDAAYGHHTCRRASLTLVVAVLLVAGCGGSTSSATHLTLNTGAAPWPDPDHVPDRVASAGLPGASSESLDIHPHAHLDILVNGHSEPVAASIGRQDDSFFSPLHTHASSGMIRIEAPRDQRFTLGMLFTEWGVRLTRDCVGGYCRPATRIRAYVDGHRTSQPLPDIVFTKGTEIALVIGSSPSSISLGLELPCKDQSHPGEPRPVRRLRPIAPHSDIQVTSRGNGLQ
jgi:hypothetical protein